MAVEGRKRHGIFGPHESVNGRGIQHGKEHQKGRMANKALEGKVAIVTGAAQGIGCAIAERFLLEGAKVLLADIDGEAAERARKGLRESYGKNVDACRLDVSDRGSVRQTVAKCVDSFGVVDILVNNAGVVNRGKVEDLTLESWNRILAVNLTGTLLCSQAVIPVMRSAGGGVILNASSVSARLPDVNLGAYCVSKAGIEILTKVMSAELAPYGIRVNAYSPGVTRTPMTQELIGQRGEEKLRHIPLKRFGEPEDIAELAVFLCGPRSSFVTGAVFSVDGGTMAVEHPWKAWQ
jgi:NAD(P)-dependent dehydrogenase (short-subunit alcohol dehydrogenase family)